MLYMTKYSKGENSHDIHGFLEIANVLHTIEYFPLKMALPCLINKEQGIEI